MPGSVARASSAPITDITYGPVMQAREACFDGNTQIESSQANLFNATSLESEEAFSKLTCSVLYVDFIGVSVILTASQNVTKADISQKDEISLVLGIAEILLH